MSTDLRVANTAVSSAVFATYHQLPIPNGGCILTLDGNKLGGGGFAGVYPVKAVSGTAPAKAMAVKIFSDAGIRALGGRAGLVDSVSRLVKAAEARGGADWCDGLLALPYAVVEGRLRGLDVVAALMVDLAVLGYSPAPFEPREAARYRSRDLTQRLDLAVCFAKRCALLEGIRFIHGDLNTENILVSTDDVQILDFDTGAVVERGDERPRTWGKTNDCLPPEVKGNGTTPPDLARFTQAAERWSLGTMMGYHLFGASPAFFLSAISVDVIRDYAKTVPGWPAVDETGPLFSRLAPNRLAYRALQSQLDALPQVIKELFRRFFAAGLDGARRPSASDWVAGLLSLRQPPELEHFVVEDTVVIRGDLLLVSWAAHNATHVEIDGLGRRPPRGSEGVALQHTGGIRIRAVSPYGFSDAVSPVVHVLEPPPAYVGPQIRFALRSRELTHTVRGFRSSSPLGSSRSVVPNFRPTPGLIRPTPSSPINPTRAMFERGI